MLNTVKGVFSLFYLFINLSFWLIPVLICSLIKFCIPIPRVEKFCYHIMAQVYRLAIICDNFLLYKILKIKIHLHNPNALDEKTHFPGQWFTLVANHQSWMDILILQGLFYNKIPVLKFLVKREMIFVPVVGIICWAYEFPFLERKKNKLSHGKHDLQNIKKSLMRFKKSPTTVVNFLEGTRFHPRKNKIEIKQYEYLLPPKTGGFNLIKEEMQEYLNELIDVTIFYHIPSTLTSTSTTSTNYIFWKMMSGQLKEISLQVERIPFQEIKHKNVDDLLKDRWKKKDQLLQIWHREKNNE